MYTSVLRLTDLIDVFVPCVCIVFCLLSLCCPQMIMIMFGCDFRPMTDDDDDDDLCDACDSLIALGLLSEAPAAAAAGVL